MNKITLALFVVFSVLLACGVSAQEKPKADAPKSEQKMITPIPLRVQVLFTEFDGDKKIASLPYTFSVNADEHHARPDTSIRDGVRMPIQTNPNQYTYMDVGTNIDCSAQTEGDNRYKLVLTVERNSISQESTQTGNPVVRQFKAEMNPILRDGQNFESVMATDPVNGHVYRVSVTLSVVK